MSAKKPIDDFRQTNWHQAVVWHGVSILPRLRELDRESLKSLLDEANECNMSQPLHLCLRPQFVVPSWSERKLTGGQVTALLVFGLWVIVGEDKGMASGLLNDWPEIEAACFLAGERKVRAAA